MLQCSLHCLLADNVITRDVSVASIDAGGNRHQVAQVLQQHLDLVQIEVQGHTDDQGRAKTNTALSQARAAAVVAYLRRRGVAADRLVARGYGPERPLAPNTSAAGREKNRRVEFHVLRRRAAREIIQVEEAK